MRTKLQSEQDDHNDLLKVEDDAIIKALAKQILKSLDLSMWDGKRTNANKIVALIEATFDAMCLFYDVKYNPKLKFVIISGLTKNFISTIQAIDLDNKTNPV